HLLRRKHEHRVGRECVAHRLQRACVERLGQVYFADLGGKVLGNRKKRDRHAYVYFRRSSITLPSFGRLPGATSSTSPRSWVTSRIDATSASPRLAEESAASHLSVMRSLPLSPSTTRRARTTSGWRRTMSAIWRGVTNRARTLVL